MLHFIELDHLEKIDGWGMNTLLVLLHPIAISFIGTVVFAVLGAFALYKQVKRIGAEGAEAVSVEWHLVFLAMFAALMPYGFERDSLALVIQGLIRAPFYVVIVWQLYGYRTGFNRFQWLLTAIMALAIAASLVQATLVATGLLWVSVVTAAHQPWKIFRTKNTKGVERRVLVVYLWSAFFWMSYGFAVKDYYIVSWAIGYAVVYSSGLIAYRIYRPVTTA